MLGSARSALIHPMPDPVAAYNFSEGSGLTSADRTGHGYTLTLNDTNWTGAGHTGNGLTSTTNGLGASASFIATDAVTLMAWIKPLDLTSGTSHFAFGFLDNGNNTQVAIFTQRADFGTPDVLQFQFRLVTTLYALPAGPMTLNTWTHVACTYNETDARIFVNGAMVASMNQPGTINPGDGFYLAGWTPTIDYDTDVILDDVRVYKTALNRSQVVIAMNTPVS